VSVRRAIRARLALVWRGTANRRMNMFKWALIFAVIALVAAVLGFGGVAGAAAGIAKILFFIGLALVVLFLILGASAARKLS